LKEIGQSAFYGSGLSGSIRIPNSVEKLGGSCFNSCNSLREVIFESESKLKEIGQSTFYGSGLSGSIRIPNSVEKLGERCFFCCKSLNELIFESESKLKEIGQSAFYKSGLSGSIRIPNSVEKLGDSCFSSCGSLREVIFESESQLKEIGQSAFYESRLSGSIRIPNSVEKLGERCFFGCESLNEVIFESESKLKEIGGYCFNDTGVKEIEIPKECENLSGLSLCGLKTVKVAKGHNCLVVKDEFLINMNKKVLIRYFGNNSKVSINNCITVISDGCFCECKSLNEVIFESNSQLKEIGQSAFRESGLSGSIRVSSPNSVEKL
jgi:hypothetical protein